MSRNRFVIVSAVLAAVLAAVAFSGSARTASADNGIASRSYVQTNLVSDIPGLAAHTDPNLKNPWGLVHSTTSPWWISDNNAGVSTLYTGTGTPVPLQGASRKTKSNRPSGV